MTHAIDSLGCAADGLHTSREVQGSGVRFHRKRARADGPSQVATPAADRGFLVGVALGHGHRRRIFHEHHATDHAFERNAIYIRNFSDSYRAELSGPLDFLLLEISHAFFEQTADGQPCTRVRSLECVTGVTDPVLAHLSAALLPMLERPAEASPLFVDQMGVTMATYLLEQYGGAVAASPRRPRVLSRAQESRAKEMLRARMDGEVSVTDIASACGLSRSYFIVAFRETTGVTPHRWQLNQRVEMARGLLADPLRSLAEIATTCGFADQSHFSRVFTQATGQPPGGWRRAMAR